MIEAVRQYTLPLLFALLLHAAVVAALRVGWQPDSTTVREIKPQIVMSKLIVMEPKPAPKARPKPAAPKPAATRPAPAQPKPAPEAKPKPVEAKPDPRAEEAARLAQQQEWDREAAETAASLAALSNRAFEDALMSEDQELAADASDPLSVQELARSRSA